VRRQSSIVRWGQSIVPTNDPHAIKTTQQVVKEVKKQKEPSLLIFR